MWWVMSNLGNLIQKIWEEKLFAGTQIVIYEFLIFPVNILEGFGIDGSRFEGRNHDSENNNLGAVFILLDCGMENFELSVFTSS